MGTKNVREYTNEFRLSAIQLEKELGSVSEAAASLGISIPLQHIESVTGLYCLIKRGNFDPRQIQNTI